MPPQVSIVVPARNESPNILPLCQRLSHAFAKHPGEIEIILVDDGSTDDTWTQMERAREADPRVRPLRHARSRGQSAALWTGFKAARADVIATLDADLQNDPADLPRLLGELKDADLVCGVRMRRADNFVRRASSAIAFGARRLVLGSSLRDTGCNLRVFKRVVLDPLPPFDGLHRFMPVLAAGGGSKVKQVPVAHNPRVAGITKYGVWNRMGRGILDLLGVRWFLKRQFKQAPGEDRSRMNPG
jgi:glycosyltransferase involved in cell wall biosynthesis